MKVVISNIPKSEITSLDVGVSWAVMSKYWGPTFVLQILFGGPVIYYGIFYLIGIIHGCVKGNLDKKKGQTLIKEGWTFVEPESKEAKTAIRVWKIESKSADSKTETQPVTQPENQTETPAIQNSTNTNDIMKCPFCAEDIKVGAKKCKHCGEFLDSEK